MSGNDVTGMEFNEQPKGKKHQIGDGSALPEAAGTGAVDSPAFKRARSSVHSVKVSEDIGAYFTLEQSFRELLANAFDNHVQAGLNPADVAIAPAVEADASTHGTFCIHSGGAPIELDAFNISNSKKRAFRMHTENGLKDERSWRSVIGCFGRGMTSAHACLVELGQLSIVYETCNNVLVVISTKCGAHEHEDRCICAANQAGVNIDGQSGIVVPFENASAVPAVATAAAAAEDIECLFRDPEQAELHNQLDKLHVRRFTRLKVTEAFQGTKVHFVLPKDPAEKARIAHGWSSALQSFLWTLRHNGARPQPLIRLACGVLVDKKRRDQPILELYERLPIPATVLAHAQSRDVDYDTVFINHMAYLCEGASSFFTYNILIEPVEPAKGEEQTHASRLRKDINDKRVAIGRPSINAVLTAVFKEGLAHTVRTMITSSGVNTLLVKYLSKQRIAQACGGGDVPDRSALLRSKIVEFSTKSVQLQPALADFLAGASELEANMEPDKIKSVSAVVQELLSIRKAIHEQVAQHAASRAEALEQQLVAQLQQSSEAEECDVDEAMFENDSERDEVPAAAAARSVVPPRTRTVADGVDATEASRVLKHVLPVDEFKTIMERTDRASITNVQKVIALRQLQEKSQAVLSAPTMHLCYGGQLTPVQTAPQLKELQERAPHFSWTGSPMPLDNVWKVTSINGTHVPLDLVNVLLKQGNGRAFDTVFGEDAVVRRSLDWAARRMLLYCLCCVLRSCGLQRAVDLELSIDVARPTWRAAASLMTLPKLLVPLGVLRSNPNETELQFSKRDFVWFLHAASVAMHPDSADDPAVQLSGAHDNAAFALQTMLFNTASPLLTAPRNAFRLSLSPEVNDCFHIIVLIDAWGRKFGGVSSFNMRLCETLARSTWNGKKIVVTCIAGVIDSVPNLKGLRVMVVPQVSGLLQSNERDRVAARLRSIDRRFLSSVMPPAGWPMRVHLVIGHDRFTGGEAVHVAPRFHALSLVVIHTVPLLIAATKTSAYNGGSVDKHVREIIRSADQVVLVGNTGKNSFHGIPPRHEDAPAISFRPGWMPPSAIGLGKRMEHEFDWLMEKELLRAAKVHEKVPLRLAAGGRLEDKLKNIDGVRALAVELRKAGHTNYSELYIGMEQTLDSKSKENHERAALEIKNFASQRVEVAQQAAMQPNSSTFQMAISAAQQQFDQSAATAAAGTISRADLSVESDFTPIYAPYTESESSYLEHLRMCMCALMPSTVDSYGLFAAEAAGIGMPFIVSTKTGIGQHLKNIFAQVEHQKGLEEVELSIIKELNTYFLRKVQEDGTLEKEAWMKSVEWIREKMACGRMSEYMIVLKKHWPNWDMTVQTQICNELADSQLFQRHADAQEAEEQTNSWLPY